jgi:hypothetical protein
MQLLRKYSFPSDVSDIDESVTFAMRTVRDELDVNYMLPCKNSVCGYPSICLSDSDMSDSEDE